MYAVTQQHVTICDIGEEGIKKLLDVIDPLIFYGNFGKKY